MMAQNNLHVAALTDISKCVYVALLTVEDFMELAIRSKTNILLFLRNCYIFLVK